MMPASSALKIAETQPTSLLKDFDTFIQFLRDRRVVLTPIKKFLRGKVLYEINQKMTHPVADTSPKTIQPFYTLLHLFYHLVLAGKLFLKVSERAGTILKPTERLELYEKLTHTEKYFFLLETVVRNLPI